MKTALSFKMPLLAGAFIASFGISEAIAQPLYPTTVVQYNVGTSQDGLSIGVPSGRDDANNALFPENSDVDMGEIPGNSSTVNFVSLGFGGEIILGFSQPFGQGEGSDLDIFETSYGTPNCANWSERADVYVSQDGCNWVMVAENACQNFSVELPSNMPWALYVRIVDASPNASFAANADGYDVDGVRANYLSNVTLKGDEDLRFADGYMNFVQGSIKANAATLPAANRRDPMKAVGPTAGSDVAGTPVFVSLGFDNMATAAEEGQITLSFDYTVFDRDGADLTVFETTFGDNAARTCANYPEVAEFWGSNDGSNWTLLTAASVEPDDAYLGGSGRLCRDGQLDISNMPMMNGAKTLRYLKIVDKSIKSSSRFPGGADGYDVDGVFAYPCGDIDGGRIALYDQNNYPDEDMSMFFAGIAPNPASDVVNVKIETASKDQNYVIRVIDIMGRVISQDGLNASANSFVNHVMDVQTLPAGIYMISIESGDYKVIEKLIKN
jgi:hypothetical protein